MEPITLLTLFAPALVDAAKAAINRFITPDTFKPANMAEVIQLQTLELEKFKAMNDASGADAWVQNIIKLQRPVIAAVALTVWAYSEITHTPNTDAQTLAQCVFFYLFGERTMLKTGRA